MHVDVDRSRGGPPEPSGRAGTVQVPQRACRRADQAIGRGGAGPRHRIAREARHHPGIPCEGPWREAPDRQRPAGDLMKQKFHLPASPK